MHLPSDSPFDLAARETTSPGLPMTIRPTPKRSTTPNCPITTSVDCANTRRIQTGFLKFSVRGRDRSFRPPRADPYVRNFLLPKREPKVKEEHILEVFEQGKRWCRQKEAAESLQEIAGIGRSLAYESLKLDAGPFSTLIGKDEKTGFIGLASSVKPTNAEAVDNVQLSIQSIS
jgi:hypothetical protein